MTDTLVIVGAVMLAICLLMIVLVTKSGLKHRREARREAAEELSRIRDEDA